MAEPYMGQIIAIGFNFVPDGWALCDGSLLSIGKYEALFQVLGTTYGGDGSSTFALPDLRGRLVVSQTGQPDYPVGQAGGSESVALGATQIGAHKHKLMASSPPGTIDTPNSDKGLAQNAQAAVNMYVTGVTPDVGLSPAAIGGSGGAAPHENRQPYRVLNYIICLNGVFPARP
jgi:microcystin-dependent protein